MRISYDDTKREKTSAERGLDFADAAKVFGGIPYTEYDTRHEYGEDREISVGTLDGEVVVVVWTERNGDRRVISMRKADRDERAEYREFLDRSG